MIWLRHLTRDLRHALRSIAGMPVLSAVVILSLAVGIGVNVVVFSWLQAVVLKPLPGVADARAFHFVEPRAETASHPGASWLEYRDLARRAQVVPRAARVPDGAVQRRRSVADRARLRAARVGQLLHGSRPASAGRALPGAWGHGPPRLRAGRRDLARLLAVALPRLAVGDWPDDPDQRSRPRRRRRDPGRISGHDARARLLPLGPGDDGAVDAAGVA